MTGEERARRDAVIAKLREVASDIITDDREIALIVWDRRSGRLECLATHRDRQDLQNQLCMWRDQTIGDLAVQQHVTQTSGVTSSLEIVGAPPNDDTTH